MIKIDDLANAAIAGQALQLRSLAQEWLSQCPEIASSPEPISSDARVRAVAAGLVGLFAERRHQSEPAWASAVAPLDEPLFLVRSAERMPRLRELCRRESPAPLRRRNLFAPPTFLEFA
jgi:hypothetical protein